MPGVNGGPNGIRPFDAEELRQRQERRDTLSKLMANYMLRGYKMLDAYCDECTVGGA